MAKEILITRARNGTNERIVKASELNIPDLWHIAMGIKDSAKRDMVLEVWYLCHDLQTHILENEA